MNHAPADCEARLRIAQAQRDEARADAERFLKAGNYLHAALNFYCPDHASVDYRRDAYYKDAHMALAGWAAATEENNHA